MVEPHLVQILEPRIPNHVIYTYCGLRKPFNKETEYWKIVKSTHLKHSLALKVRMICAEYQKPNCPHKSFVLTIPVSEQYQRATLPLISEAIAVLIQDKAP